MRIVEQQVTLHPQLKQGWLNFYNWTSDAQGIRHGLMNEPSLSQADARYMYLSCSAFIGLLIAKCAAAGIDVRRRA